MFRGKNEGLSVADLAVLTQQWGMIKLVLLPCYKLCEDSSGLLVSTLFIFSLITLLHSPYYSQSFWGSHSFLPISRPEVQTTAPIWNPPCQTLINPRQQLQYSLLWSLSCSSHTAPAFTGFPGLSSVTLYNSVHTCVWGLLPCLMYCSKFLLSRTKISCHLSVMVSNSGSKLSPRVGKLAKIEALSSTKGWVTSKYRACLQDSLQNNFNFPLKVKGGKHFLSSFIC